MGSRTIDMKAYRRRKRERGLCVYGGCEIPTPRWYCPEHIQQHGLNRKINVRRQQNGA